MSHDDDDGDDGDDGDDDDDNDADDNGNANAHLAKVAESVCKAGRRKSLSRPQEDRNARVAFF